MKKRPLLYELRLWLLETYGWCGTPYMIVCSGRLTARAATLDEAETTAACCSRVFGEARVYCGEMLAIVGSEQAALEAVYRNGIRE